MALNLLDIAESDWGLDDELQSTPPRAALTAAQAHSSAASQVRSALEAHARPVQGQQHAIADLQLTTRLADAVVERMGAAGLLLPPESTSSSANSSFLADSLLGSSASSLSQQGLEAAAGSGPAQCGTGRQRC